MNEIIVKNGNEISLAKEVIERIKTVNDAVKAAKSAEEELKASILKAFEENGVYRLDNAEEDISIVYFPETETTVFDQNAFKAEMPDLYLDYCTKKSNTSSFVKIGKAPKSAKNDRAS